jgi:hypothetical protein
VRGRTDLHRIQRAVPPRAHESPQASASACVRSPPGRCPAGPPVPLLPRPPPEWAISAGPRRNPQLHSTRAVNFRGTQRRDKGADQNCPEPPSLALSCSVTSSGKRPFAYIGVPPPCLGEICLGAFLLLKPRVVLGTWAAFLLHASPLNLWPRLFVFTAYGDVWQVSRGVYNGIDLLYTTKFFIIKLLYAFSVSGNLGGIACS